MAKTVFGGGGGEIVACGASVENSSGEGIVGVGGDNGGIRKFC